MSIFEHSRFEIFNQSQHPYKHSLGDFGYSNGALPGVTNVEEALNYISAFMYPKYVGTSATPALLPTGVDTPTVGDVTPDLNDYRVVLDDGDGKQAGYRWEQRDGDVSPIWYKVFDVDWSTDGILASLMDITSDVYVFQKGKTDLDELGDPITGVFAGQRVWGGNLTNQNLTLDANSADSTGYVQTNNDFRPVTDAAFDLGTATEQFDTAYLATSALIADMTIAAGSITSTSGAISFGDENLSTTGFVEASILEATDAVNSIFIDEDSITATIGSISFDDENLNGTGDLSFAAGTFSGTVGINADLTLAAGSITSASGTISFGDENLTTTGNITGTILNGGQLNIDNLRLDGNTISTTNTNGNMVIIANGTGLIDVDSAMETVNITSNGTVTVNGILDADNVRIDGDTISTIAGDLTLDPFTALLNVDATILPNADGTRNLGSAALRFQDIFLSNSIQDGTNTFLISELMELRSASYRDAARTQPAQTGDSLFYDATLDLWLASTPDSEISHTGLSDLTVGDAGHTQFALLAGRSGGQSLIGGVSASENLVLESTSHATKGAIVTSDTIRPDTDATFSGGWQGLDLGASSFNFRDLYMKGEAKGLRLENYTSGTLPASSANNTGRVAYATDNKKIYVDDGSAWTVAGVSKYAQDVAFDGIVTTVNVDVSSVITDARLSQIQLLDNSNDFERIIGTIKATSASNVRIQTNVPLPAGSYRLIVME